MLTQWCTSVSMTFSPTLFLFHSCSPFVFIFSPTCTLAVTTSEPLQPLPVCLKQEMSPKATNTSSSPNMTTPNMAFVELQALQKPVSVNSSCSTSNHFPNAFNSFSHHAPVYGQFSSQSIISGNAGIRLIHVHTHTVQFFSFSFVQCKRAIAIFSDYKFMNVKPLERTS